MSLLTAITGISTRFINLAPEDTDDGIRRALQTVGELARADRGYVFLLSDDRSALACTHEWCAPGVARQIDRTRSVSLEAHAWSTTQLLRLYTLHIPHVADLPDAAAPERDEFILQGIQSLIAVPMVYRGKAVGFLGFDAVRAPKTWSKEEIALLKIAGEIFVNALEHRRALAIESTQRQFLELLAAGGISSETLVALIRIIQAQSPGMLGLILLLEPDGRRLRLGAGPGLPPGYLTSLAGLEIGPRAGSCGAAVHTRRRVIAVDIAADPYWEGALRAESLRHGLRACWAEPVFGAQGQVLGAFAMYYPNRRLPGEDDLRLLAIAAHLTGIAIERGRADEALRLANLALEQRVDERTREIERRRQVAEGLRDLLAVLNSNRPLGEILQTIVAQAARLTGAGTTLLHRIDYEREFVVIEAHHGLPAEAQYIRGFPLHRAGPDRAILDRRPFAIPDIAEYAAQSDPADPDELAWIGMMRPGYRAWLAIPLVVNEAVYGSLTFCYWEPQEFSDEEVRLAMAFGDQAALALENNALRAQAEQAAIVAERSRLARDLHDSVTQTLFSAGLIAEVLPRIWERNPAQGRVQLAELRQLTRGALAEMRTLLLELRPATLTEVGLGDLLRQLGEAVTGRARVPVAVSVERPRPLPPDVQIALYRIAQEALNNVAKHAGPCQAAVHLACGPAGVQLHIADDGRGFDPGRVSAEHLGLGIMRERADAVGATLTVTAQPGQGTQVDVTWRDAAGDKSDND